MTDRRRTAWLLSAAFVAGALVLCLPGWAHAAAEGEPKKHMMDIMEENVALMVFTVVLFVTVLGVLWKFAWGPLLKALDEREGRIRDSLEAADRAREESRQASLEHERVLAEARRQASAIIEEGKRDAQVVKDGIVAQARCETEALRTRTLAEIERAKNNAVYEIHDRAVELSYLMVEKIIGKALSPSDHEALVKDTIVRYTAMKGTRTGS